MASLVAVILLAMACLANALTNCTASNFANITLFGGEVLSVSATPYQNHSTPGPSPQNPLVIAYDGLAFCEVIVQYTHPGQNDSLTVWVWLPTEEDFNGRFMGVGGGGFATTLGNLTLAPAVSAGYVAAATDGGHRTDIEAIMDPGDWALVSLGNVNWALLLDFAGIALDDMATLGKEVTHAFYGSPPNYSYWNGCSTGGRQGHMMAQRYPKQYNGILANAPAMNWADFIPAEYWPQQVMNQLGEAPRLCELKAITDAAIQACDSLDGLADGVVALPGQCKFDAYSIVGQTFNCTDTGQSMKISLTAAKVADASWRGPSNVDGEFLWYGLLPSASLSGLAATNCTDNSTRNSECTPAPFEIALNWIRYFLAKDPDFDASQMNYSEYDMYFRRSREYHSVIGTASLDLTDFRNAGGKLLTWHGLEDSLIPVNGTVDYFRKLLATDPNANDYARFFEAPGVDHCGGGKGWVPIDDMERLVNWVEKGVAPEILTARTMPTNPDEAIREANVCLYPKSLVYVGGDVNVASSFECR